MKVLITGATGFLGKELVSNFSKDDFEMICLSRFSQGESSVSRDNVKYIQTDISASPAAADLEIIDNVDVIIHCAGLAHQFGNVKRELFEQVNVRGTENISKYAVRAKCKRFILMSTVAVYGEQFQQKSIPIAEDNKCAPKGSYAETKFEGENVCKEILIPNKIPLTILRPVTIIGEEDKGNVMRLIKFINSGLFIWIGKGENKKSLIYKKDVAKACELIITKSDKAFEIYNLSAEPLSMKNIVNIISDSLNKKRKTFYLPKTLIEKFFSFNKRTFSFNKLIKLEETIRKWSSEEIFSAQLIEQTYGFKPAVSIEQAIRSETEWYLKTK